MSVTALLSSTTNEDTSSLPQKVVLNASQHQRSGSGFESSSVSPSSVYHQLQFWDVFGGLLTSHSHQRTSACAEIESIIRQALRHSVETEDPLSTPASHFLSVHMPSIVRLSLECPFCDVRQFFKDLLCSLNKEMQFSEWGTLRPLREGPSKFFPFHICPVLVAASGQDEEKVEEENDSDTKAAAVSVSAPHSPLSVQFEDIFLSTGRINHIEWLLGWHPAYLEHYTQTMDFIMNEEAGSLPRPWCHYIAILAATRHHCDYLIHWQEWEFLQCQGDATWLQSISHAPKKLQTLHELNALLAHQPWLITNKHIEKLVKSSGGGEDNWSISELVHALMIMSTFHALCGLVYGVGITEEVDLTDLRSRHRRQASVDAAATLANAKDTICSSVVKPSTGNSPPNSVTDGDILIEMLKHHSDQHDTSNSTDTQADEQEQMKRHTFQTVDEIKQSTSPIQSASTTAAPGLTISSTDPTSHTRRHNTADGDVAVALSVPMPSPVSLTSLDTSRYSSTLAPELQSFQYQLFDLHVHSAFEMSDYSWKADGIPLVDEFYPGFAPLIDAQWDLITALTYSTISHNTQMKMDTTPFRQAIWYYVYRLYGIYADDYDYASINKYLSSTLTRISSLKSLLRLLACTPERVKASDVELPGYSFHPDEKEHIVLLVIEARRQAEVLYALHAVMNYKSGRH